MSSNYAKQKLWEAVRALAIQDDSLQRRLADAAISLVHLRTIENTLAIEHRKKLTVILDSLTKETAVGDEGAIATQKLTSQEAIRVAEAIFELYTDLHGAPR
jgi:hypothetical protein